MNFFISILLQNSDEYSLGLAHILILTEFALGLLPCQQKLHGSLRMSFCHTCYNDMDVTFMRSRESSFTESLVVSTLNYTFAFQSTENETE